MTVQLISCRVPLHHKVQFTIYLEPETQANAGYNKKNLQYGFIHPPLFQPVLGSSLVQKKGGGLHPSIDYKGLHKISISNKYPFISDYRLVQLNSSCQTLLQI